MGYLVEYSEESKGVKLDGLLNGIYLVEQYIDALVFLFGTVDDQMCILGWCVQEKITIFLQK